MISIAAGVSIAIAAFVSAFVTGVFGMAGGQILLAVLLYYLPVSAAMTVFSGLMFTSGLWRAVLWRQHVNWGIALRVGCGLVVGYALMLLIAFVPSKPLIYLGLGLTPILGDLAPKRFAPDVSKPPLALFCGFLIMILQITVGAAGNVLDMFFQASPLGRHAIVATKAVVQLISQSMRFVYFGAIALAEGQNAPWQIFVLYALLTVAGGSASTRLLEAMSEKNFRLWTRRVILGLSALYVARGLWLLLIG